MAMAMFICFHIIYELNLPVHLFSRKFSEDISSSPSTLLPLSNPDDLGNFTCEPALLEWSLDGAMHGCQLLVGFEQNGLSA